MTQIVTISATTAGYVMDALRPTMALRGAKASAKVSNDTSVQKLSADAGVRSASPWSDATTPQAISLFFLTADLPEQGQTTQAEAESAYREQADSGQDVAQISSSPVATLEAIED